MTREQAYQLTMSALANLQWNTALILEAKASEAEKVRNWLLTHVTQDTWNVQSEQLSTSLDFHDQNVELIESLTKLCNGLNRNMKAILEPEEEEEGGDMASLFSGLDMGSSDK